MKVLTLDNQAFFGHCVELEAKIKKDFQPDLILGILHGGGKVAENLFCELPHTFVSLRRPSTEKKEKSGLIMRFVNSLPVIIKDGLRICEARLLSLKQKKTIRQIHIDGAMFENRTHVLVVDDAVDSGVTMKSVLDAISKSSRDLIIRSAVITVTTKNPILLPDYFLYHNQTLIRFPWSKDNQAGK